MMLWRHILFSDCSTPQSFVRFTFDEKIKSIHDGQFIDIMSWFVNH